LIAATTDNSFGIDWGNVGINVPNAESPDDGATNTANIVATLTPDIQAINTYAAGICSEYAGGGYTDWFLPAENQLACLCANQLVVGGFAAVNYWGSTEINQDLAQFRYFGDCSQGLYDKSFPFRARCVRVLTL
jgi:hypothetical protein